MKKEEKLKILLDAERRTYETLRTVDMGTEQAKNLLEHITSIGWLKHSVSAGTCTCGGECCGNAEEAPAQEPEELPTPADNPVPETEEHASEPEPTHTLTKDDVVRVLRPIQNTAPDDLIPGVMKEMGYINLSAIPAARYQELLDRVEAAMKTEEQ